jgi:hypothetical protein
MRWRVGWLACMVAVAVGAQSQSVPAKFLLELRGGQIGRADYQFTESKSGFEVKAHYSFSLGGSTHTLINAHTVAALAHRNVCEQR